MSTDAETKPVRVTYIWLGGKDAHHDIRSKDRTLYFTAAQLLLPPKELLRQALFPAWNFDGSSTGQSKNFNTEILLVPVNAFPCCLPRASCGGRTPIPWILVLAECCYPSGEPTEDNSRAIARDIFDQLREEKPWFGMEQEFFIMQNSRPYGWPASGLPPAQGPYYCSTGVSVAWGRKYVDLLLEVCLQMGIRMSGTNAEVTPGQWEFQVGPCEGIEVGDQMIVARWVLLRLLEEEGLDVCYAAKPIEGDWNGSGMHTNFSTESTRKQDGLEAIYTYIDRLSKSVQKDIVFYGAENDKRLTGDHETSKATEFSHGVGARHSSIRIPNSVFKERRGYLEDRRPAGDADPYLVSSRLFASAADLNDSKLVVVTPTFQKPWMVFGALSG